MITQRSGLTYSSRPNSVSMVPLPNRATAEPGSPVTAALNNM